MKRRLHGRLTIEESFSQIWTASGLVDRSTLPVDLCDDRTFDGRALIETTRTFSGVPWLWNRHLLRVRETALRFGKEPAAIELPTVEDVQKYVAQLGVVDVVVRLNLLIARDSFPGLPAVWINARPLPSLRNSIKLRVCDVVPHSIDGQATAKGLRRMLLAARRQDADDRGFDDALLLDENRDVAETTWANIFFRFDEGWATPALNGALLPGTARALILEHRLLNNVHELGIPVDRLSSCREALLCNSVRGVIPVAQIDELHVAVGEQTQQLQAAIFDSSLS